MTTHETGTRPSPTAHAARYANPVRYDDGVVRTNPDPFVMRFRGRYYCYSTGEAGVNVSLSADLVRWTSLGRALAVPGRRQFWAPCVIYVDGVFWMYFSDRPAGSDDPHDERLQVATSERPEGPFTVRRRFFDTFSIDPHAVRDPETGQYVLFYSTNDVTGLSSQNPGTAILVDRLVTMDRLAGAPRPVVVPTIEEEIFERDRFGDGRDWYTIEGASYFAHHDTAFLTYSGNAYTGADYFIGYSRAALPGRVDELAWTKYPSDYAYAPLVRRNADVEGTGHNSVVRAPDLVDDWLVYHGRDAADELDPLVEQRVMRIDRLFHDGDRLSTDAPTAGPQDAPARPTLFEDFAGPTLASGWRVLAGAFAPAGGAVRSGPDHLGLLVHERAVEHLVAEVYLRAEATHLGARYGVVPVLHGVDDYVAVALDVATRTVVATQVRGGLVETLGSAPLGAIDPSAWHVLHVERTFDLVEVWLDGARALSVRVDDAGPGRVGLVTVGTVAEFSALTVTEHLDLHGDRLRHLPAVYRADRPVDVTPHGVGSPSRRPVRLVAERLPAEAVLTHEVELVAPYAKADVDPVHAGPDRYVRVRLRPASFQVLVAAGGAERLVAEGEHGRRRLSVRAEVTRDAVVLRVGDRTYRLPNPAAGQCGGRVELAGSLLRGLEITPIVENPLGDQPTE